MPSEASSDVLTDLSALQDPLLILLLEKAVNTDPQLEKLLLRVRRELLAHALRGTLGDALKENGAAFLSALAQQCFLNEYVYYETPGETHRVEALFEAINQDLRRVARLEGECLALLATYRPLWELAFAPQIFRHYEPSREDFLYKVIRLQLISPMIERGMRAEIPRMTEIEDETSQAVRAQYEENPYPRWLYTDHHEPRSVGSFMTTLFPHLQTRRRDWPDKPSVLVAGCGTGKQAISAAMRFTGCNVTAMDLSLHSLAYGLRMAQELSVANIEYVQGDILELPDLGRSFDIVECVGVLHHMADPLLGWRILADLLQPGGLMRVGLYSSRARRPVSAARRYVKKQGLKPTRDDIRSFRRNVMSMPGDEPVAQITRMADFYSTSECRDLVFHVQQREFNLGEIAECLECQNLELLGFEFGDDAALHRYAALYPDDAAMTDLGNWQDFEERHPDTFASMYQFWVSKR